MTRPIKNVTAISPRKVIAATNMKRGTAHKAEEAPLRFLLGSAAGEVSDNEPDFPVRYLLTGARKLVSKVGPSL